ncbi:PREDICTED: succinate dehydrogenase assembly factor 2, mitochondrial [Fragaria vesca subsp. vesca]|uniref:succinate dehydrogenase assembly factor 2, mitochondrial n=1 Tax=Fragaria vesca subsp. vesca TaxID=101020 RepID=UPI0002C35D72|nr:PREDICTED: succinate dehydrogenase assembly factor 2, mitochondrial [Fragaria vesca subsp. vesca]
MASLRRALISAHRALKSSNSISPTQTLLRPQYSSGLVQRSYSTDNSSNLNIDLSNEESKRRLCNRLLYRSKQRGFLELDLVLGKWVEDHIHSMDESGIKALVDVLDVENPDLWKWLSGQEQPPQALITNPVFTAVRNKVTKNLDSYAAPETRATPGNPWVRGWDDIKKYKGGPITGNQ